MFNKREKLCFIGKLKLSKSALYLTNNYLIALSSQCNCLYDISDKTNPRIITDFIISKYKDSITSSLLGFIDKKAYFRIGYTSAEVIDFHDETQPANLGLIPYVTIGSRCEFYVDRYLVTNTRTLVIYDLTTPLNPKTVYEFQEEMVDFILVKTCVICATLNSGIKTYDITQPSKPRLASSLHLDAVKLVAKNHEVFVAQGSDDMLHIVDASDMQNLRIINSIEIPGPIAANSLVCAKDYLYVRYMRKICGDTAEVFNIANTKSPKKLFSHKCMNMPLYMANDRLMVFMGIKNWDGSSPITNYTTSIYQFFSISSNKVKHIGDIELDGIFFSSIVLTDKVVYISRPNEICLYEIKSE